MSGKARAIATPTARGDPTRQEKAEETTGEKGGERPRSQEGEGGLASSKEEEIKHTYCAFGVACSEVEVDSLTGETKVLRTDIVYDCGKPLNPAIDLGQIEGGFVCGLGFLLREQVQHTGSEPTLFNHGTWEYKPPCSLDVPIDFRVAFLGKTQHREMVLSSKASGEPPLVLATSAFMALREAIAAARRENGIKSDFFTLHTPAMVDDVLAACCGASDAAMAETSKRVWKEEKERCSDGAGGSDAGGLADVAKQFR